MITQTIIRILTEWHNSRAEAARRSATEARNSGHPSASRKREKAERLRSGGRADRKDWEMGLF